MSRRLTAAEGWCRVCRGPYPKEFKQGAIDLARMGGRPVREIAAELGIAESCLRRWLKQDQMDRRERDDGLTSAERDNQHSAASL